MPGPLEGVRVLDLSQVISGPMAATWLADQGADVIKVEDAGMGDFARYLGPRKADISAMFLTANRGKRSISLNLKSPDDQAVLWALIEKADVLIQNFRPGAIERLGFGPEPARARNPRLIYCSISGYGPTGPFAGARVYDPIIQASSGFAATQADPATGEPQLIRTLVCDKLTALTAAQAITAALFAREKSGEGQFVEIAMLDAAIAFLWPEGMYNHTFLEDPPPPSPDFGAFYRLWKSRDGYFAVAGVQDAEFKALARGLGRPDLAEDERFSTLQGRMVNGAQFMQEMGAAIASRTNAELVPQLLAEDAPAARVNTREDLKTDPQVIENGAIVETDHADLGRIQGPRHPARFHGTPVGPPGLAPHLGEHTAAIKGELA
jgi:crotonobetainyl-CoA:carnitine CoA-transferase CaiB-like acyl-CoA transferase